MGKSQATIGFESLTEVLTAAREVDPDVTKDQIARLHRAELISRPQERYQKGRKGRESLYPIGTAERVRHIEELKLDHRNLDEIAWRLWWSGVDMNMVPVRRYLTKIAERTDKGNAAMKIFATAYVSGTMNAKQRNQYTRFFEGEKVGPLFGPVRKRLGTESDSYQAFVDLVLRLAAGNDDYDKTAAKNLLELTSGFDQAKVTTIQGSADWFPGLHESTFDLAPALMPASLVERVHAISDGELCDQRDFWIWYKQYISTVGEVFQKIYEGAGLVLGRPGSCSNSLLVNPPCKHLPSFLTRHYLISPRFAKAWWNSVHRLNDGLPRDTLPFRGCRTLHLRFPQ